LEHVNAMPTVLDQLSPAHEIADHVSEVRLRVRAGSLGDLLEEAGRAVAQLQLRRADAARDRAALLVDWLNELIFLAEAKRWVGADFEVDSAQDGRVRARVWGLWIQRAPALLKAASRHGVRVDDVPGGLEATVILEVGPSAADLSRKLARLRPLGVVKGWGVDRHGVAHPHRRGQAATLGREQ
jgi:SHS2 domain-containing protein